MSEVFKYKRLYKLNGVPTVDCVCGATVRFKSFMRHVETNKHKRKIIVTLGQQPMNTIRKLNCLYFHAAHEALFLFFFWQKLVAA